ncbi:MAG: nucleotidyltransferase domain-containing protein [bacterium]
MALATDVEKKIERLIHLVAKEFRVEAVYLFGSTANGSSHEWSDIDLAIVSPDFTGDSFEDTRQLFPSILQVDTSIEVHTFRPSDFDPTNPFVKEIMTTGIRVC